MIDKYQVHCELHKNFSEYSLLFLSIQTYPGSSVFSPFSKKHDIF